MIGLILWTISDSKSFDGFIPGGAFLGLGLLSSIHFVSMYMFLMD